MLALRPPLATRDVWVHINLSIAYNTVTFIKMKEVRCASGVIEHIRGQRHRERRESTRRPWISSKQCLKARGEWQMLFLYAEYSLRLCLRVLVFYQQILGIQITEIQTTAWNSRIWQTGYVWHECTFTTHHRTTLKWCWGVFDVSL